MKTNHDPKILRDLGNGLVMRRSIAADSARIAEFNKHIHLTDETREPDEGVAAWTRDLMNGRHPTFGQDDFTLVEESASGRIVSAVCLIDQTWTYEDIRFDVGRPELVGTIQEYRRRGLVREQFKEIHRLSEERGQKVQAITGIPWYYRQFGYEMGLGLGGGRTGYVPGNIPVLDKGKSEPYKIRRALEEDAATITRLCASGSQRWLVNDVRDDKIWRYDLSGRTAGNVNRLEMRMIEGKGRQPVGFLAYWPGLNSGRLFVAWYELAKGQSYSAVTATVLRYLTAQGARKAAQQKKDFKAISFHLGPVHPVYEAAGDRMPSSYDQYAWYIRVPDVPGFLELIAPVLERRVSESPLAGYSGTLRLSLYRSGVQLTFDKGCLKASEPWAPDQPNDGHAAFPEYTFLQLLFGHRSYAELKAAFADVWSDNPDVRTVLSVLFPKKPSRTWGLA